MRVFGIGDLHLSLGRPKPMERFGPGWAGHPERLEARWRARVHPSDLVLIPGDISWAMKLEDALPDLAFIDGLPGRKVMIPGNHDFWWPSMSKLRKEAPEGLCFLWNDAVVYDGVAVGGTRLWSFPFVDWSGLAGGQGPEREENQETIRHRAILRLERSLKSLDRLTAETRVVMTHFPPVGPEAAPNPLTERLSDHGVDLCVFGHLHQGLEHPLEGFDCVLKGVRYVLVSCDVIEFRPRLLLDIPEDDHST